MPNHRNPIRRNRNIGTAKQGHGQDNRDGVASSWKSCVWRRDRPHSIARRYVWGREMPFLVDHTRADCVHACTVDDVAQVLNQLPKLHISNQLGIPGVQGVVLRQPTRKEDSLNPTWASMGYGVEIGHLLGPVIYLSATQLPLTCRIPTSVQPDAQRELDRLIAAADRVEHSRREHILGFDLEGVRRVQLYHSLPHEVGHWNDFLTKVELPGLEDLDEWNRLWDRYFQRPQLEREEYAHRYAEKAVERLRKQRRVPFERILDPDQLQAEGLRLQDFQLGPVPGP